MDFQALTRFQKSKADFKLTKIGSKRPGSMVGVGQFEEGTLRLFEFRQRPGEIEPPMGVAIESHSLDGGFLRTSPVVKIVEEGKDFTVFETVGGIYRLEKI